MYYVNPDIFLFYLKMKKSRRRESSSDLTVRRVILTEMVSGMRSTLPREQMMTAAMMRRTRRRTWDSTRTRIVRMKIMLMIT